MPPERIPIRFRAGSADPQDHGPPLAGAHIFVAHADDLAPVLLGAEDAELRYLAVVGGRRRANP